ncbi:hypothetical protein HN51_027893 [Arachis hypogaea]
MVDLIEESSHNQIGNVSAEEMDELLVDSDGNDVENLLLNSTGSIGRVNFVGLSVDAAKKYVFSDLDIAYAFYNAFGRVNRFSIRKFKVGRSEIDKRILWQTFVCSREGYRIFRWVDETNRKRAPKPETRCGCVAQMRVHIDVGRDWWYTTLFQNEHNHELVPPTLSRLLRSQRRMTDQEIQRMNNMRDVGISTTQIYMQFAEQSGGFENVRFRRTDMYNQIEKQRQLMESDVTETLKYLKKRKKLDPKFYWSYEVQALERSGASVYTREVFYLFRSLLLKASSVIIVDWRETSCSVNYDVRKYCELTRKWVVSYWPELPESLILRRWTMKAKEAHIRLEQQGSLVGDGSYESRIAAMNDELEGLPFAACGDLSDFKDVMEWVRNKKAELFAKHKKNREGSSKSAGEKFKTWTDATSKESRDKKKRRRIRCSRCNGIGHNRRNCRRGDEHNQMESGDEGGSEDDDDWSSQTSEEEIDEMDFDVTIANQKGKYH